MRPFRGLPFSIIVAGHFYEINVFRGAKPEEKLYGAVYATVDRQTGKNGYILGSDLPKTKWLSVEK